MSQSPSNAVSRNVSHTVMYTGKNQLLANLSGETYQRLEPHFKRKTFLLEKVLYHPGELITKLYFPVTALLSWISLIEDGTLTEIALVGNEGMVGLPAICGGGSTPNSVIVQGAGDVMVIDAQVIREEFRRGGDLNKELFLYMQAIFTQIAQNAMCNRQHTTEERLARWLLSVQDSVQQDELSLTHDFMARMLGIRRSSVTVSAGILQQAGMIRYTRGQLSILDRPKLEDTACECYRVVQSEYHRLLNTRAQHDR